MKNRRTRGRPTKALITREKLAEAALVVALHDGYEKLTMAAVAKQLHVAPSALYNHVSGKAELTQLVQDGVMTQINVDPLRAYLNGTANIADALVEWAQSYRDVLAGHPPLVATIATTPIAGSPHTASMYALVVEALHVAGVPLRDVLDVLVSIESFIFGSALDANAPADIFALPTESAPGSPGDHLDILRKATAERTPSPAATNTYADRPFEIGVRAIVCAAAACAAAAKGGRDG